MAERPILFSAPMVRAILDGRKTQTRRVVKPQPTDYPSSPRTVAPQALRGDPPKHPAPYLDRYAKTDHWCWWDEYNRQGPDWIRCPYGVPGDRLWVKETYRLGMVYDFTRPRDVSPTSSLRWYEADGVDERAAGVGRKRVSIHMPRWASRITLRVTDVRVERLNDISEADAIAEGVTRIGAEFGAGVRPTSFDQGPNFWTVESASPLGGSLNSPTAAGAYRMLWEEINGPEAWDANPWVWAVSFEREAAR